MDMATARGRARRARKAVTNSTPRAAHTPEALTPRVSSGGDVTRSNEMDGDDTAAMADGGPDACGVLLDDVSSSFRSDASGRSGADATDVPECDDDVAAVTAAAENAVTSQQWQAVLDALAFHSPRGAGEYSICCADLLRSHPYLSWVSVETVDGTVTYQRLDVCDPVALGRRIHDFQGHFAKAVGALTEGPAEAVGDAPVVAVGGAPACEEVVCVQTADGVCVHAGDGVCREVVGVAVE